MATTNTYLTIDEPMFQFDLSTDRSANVHGSGVNFLPGAIEVLSWEFQIQQEGEQIGGKPRSVERVKPGAFKFTKAVDSRSPKLFYFCCSGEFLNEAVLHVMGPTNIAYMTVFMSWVHVASYKPAGGGVVATEEIELKYGEMSVQFNDSGLGDSKFGNSKAGKISTRWSWVFETPTQAAPGMALDGIPV